MSYKFKSFNQKKKPILTLNGNFKQALILSVFGSDNFGFKPFIPFCYRKDI